MAKRNEGTIKLDMRKVDKDRKGGFRYPEGEYKVKINDVKQATSNNGNTMLVWSGVILEPASQKGKKVSDRLVLTENAMWRVGIFLDALGLNWSNKIHTMRMSNLEGKTLGVLLADGDPYNGRVTSKVADYYTEDEVTAILSGTSDIEEEDEEEDETDEDEDIGDLADEDEDDL